MPIEKPDYEFKNYQGDLQPTLFDVDLPDGAGFASLTFEDVRRREQVAMAGFTERLREIILLNPEQRAEQGFGAVPDYYEVFLDLLDHGWLPRISAYIAWASSPRQNRWPKTQDELAHLLGLTSDRQFTKWRRNNEAIDNLITRLQLEPMLKHRADVIEALIASATDPDYKSHQDRKLFLEITGDYIPTAKLTAHLKRSMPEGEGGMNTVDLEKYADFDDEAENGSGS